MIKIMGGNVAGRTSVRQCFRPHFGAAMLLAALFLQNIE